MEIDAKMRERLASWPDTKALDEILVYYSTRYDYKDFKRNKLPHIYSDVFIAVYNRYYCESLKGVYRTMDGKEVYGKVTSPIQMNEFAVKCEPRIKEDIDRIYAFFGSKSCYELKKCESVSCLELVDYLVCRYVPSPYNERISNYRRFRYSLDGLTRRELTLEEESTLHYDPSI